MFTKLLWRDPPQLTELCGYEVAVNAQPFVQLVTEAIVTEADGRKSFLLADLPGINLDGPNVVGLRYAGKDGRRSEFATVEFTMAIDLNPPVDLTVE